MQKGPKNRKKRKKQGKRVEILREKKKFVYLHSRKGYNVGLMAEWLGTALQKLLQRFESASDLKKVRYTMV